MCIRDRFSLIDAFLDHPIHQILVGIPLPEDVRAAILSHTGPMGEMLMQVIQMERRSCDQFGAENKALVVDYALYNQAANWALETMKSLESTLE